MAIRERKDRGKWQVYWTNPWTKKRESVFCNTLLDAQKTEAQIKYRLAWERESFRPAEATEKKETTNDTIGGIVYAYLKERKFTAAGVKNTMFCSKDAVKFFDQKSITDITRRDLAEFVAFITDKYHNNTAAKICYKLRTLFLWAQRRGFIDNLPPWPETPTEHPEHFVPPSQEELASILQVAPDHIRRIIIIGAKLGLRVGPCELYDLRWSDIDLVKGVAHVRAAKKNLSEPLRDVPIKESLLPLFRQWKAADELIGIDHLIHWRGKPVRHPHVCWRKTLLRAGITRRIRLYDLRHAFATDALAAGVDVGTVARLMGHTNTVMVLKHYQHVMTSQKKAAVEALPDVPQLCPADCAQVGSPLLQ